MQALRAWLVAKIEDIADQLKWMDEAEVRFFHREGAGPEVETTEPTRKRHLEDLERFREMVAAIDKKD